MTTATLPIPVPVQHPTRPKQITGFAPIITTTPSPADTPEDAMRVGTSQSTSTSITSLALGDPLIKTVLIPSTTPSQPRRISTIPLPSLPEASPLSSELPGTSNASSTVRPAPPGSLYGAGRDDGGSSTILAPSHVRELRDYARMLRELPVSTEGSQASFESRTIMPQRVSSRVDELAVEWCALCGREGGRDVVGLRQTEGMGLQWVCLGRCRRDSGVSDKSGPPAEAVPAAAGQGEELRPLPGQERPCKEGQVEGQDKRVYFYA